MKYKLIVSDIDGVWTDNSFYYSKKGDTLRKFSTRDSYGVKLSQLMDIPILILSTEDNAMVRQRMEKLKIKHVKLGLRNKLRYLTHFCELHELQLNEVAFIGDDMNDFHLLEKVGFFACPSDAYPRIKENADAVLSTEGGNGVFREFVELLLEKDGKLDEAYERYIDLCLEK